MGSFNTEYLKTLSDDIKATRKFNNHQKNVIIFTIVILILCVLFSNYLKKEIIITIITLIAGYLEIIFQESTFQEIN